MPPRQKTWAQVRKAGVEKNSMLLANLPASSAYAELRNRNAAATGAELSGKAKEEGPAAVGAEEEEEEPLKTPKKRSSRTVSKAVEPEPAESPKKRSPRTPKRVAKPKNAAAASERKGTARPKKRGAADAGDADQKENDEDKKIESAESRDEPWPCYSDDAVQVMGFPSLCLGVARVPSHQAEPFLEALKKELTAGVPHDVVMEAKQLRTGEQVVDIRIRFVSSYQAALTKVRFENEPILILGRKPQICFVEA